MVPQLKPLQCLTNAPEEYDYGWMRTLVENVAVDDRGRSFRLCQNEDAWHLEQQVMRYGSGMYVGLTKQSEVDEWFRYNRLTLTDSPVTVHYFDHDFAAALEHRALCKQVTKMLRDAAKLDGVTVKPRQSSGLYVYDFRVRTDDMRKTVEAMIAESLKLSPWDDDAIQFPRLLDEIAGVGLTADQMDQLCESMDLTPPEIQELFDRAEEAWENAKSKR